MAHLDQGQGVELVHRVDVSLQELEVLHVGEGLAESWQVWNLIQPKRVLTLA